MARLRVGLVGVGFAGKAHLANLRRVYGVEVDVAGVTSLREDSRAAFARQHGLRAFADLAEMLPHVDVVDICTPPSAHEEAILLAAAAGKHIICEKPLSGYFGPESVGRAYLHAQTPGRGKGAKPHVPRRSPAKPGAADQYRGDRDAKGPMLKAVVEHLTGLAAAVRKAGVTFCYAENFVYAPAIQKEREIIATTGAQVLRMIGEESHSGSTSPVYGLWRFSGGGSLMGKGCHPLSALLYLKRVEGVARNGKPIRPARVTCRCEQLTRLPGFQDKGFLRTGYHDIEDHCWAHVTFEDGTVGDVISGEVAMGGLHSYIHVFANNHRTQCHLSPAVLMETYNPSADQFKDVYTLEKVGTKEGWVGFSPDEGYTLGVLGEMQDFLSCIAGAGQPQSGLDLALDTVATIYAAYLSDENRGAEEAIPLV